MYARLVSTRVLVYLKYVVTQLQGVAFNFSCRLWARLAVPFRSSWSLDGSLPELLIAWSFPSVVCCSQTQIRGLVLAMGDYLQSSLLLEWSLPKLQKSLDRLIIFFSLVLRFSPLFSSEALNCLIIAWPHFPPELIAPDCFLLSKLLITWSFLFRNLLVVWSFSSKALDYLIVLFKPLDGFECSLPKLWSHDHSLPKVPDHFIQYSSSFSCKALDCFP